MLKIVQQMRSISRRSGIPKGYTQLLAGLLHTGAAGFHYRCNSDESS